MGVGYDGNDEDVIADFSDVNEFIKRVIEVGKPSTKTRFGTLVPTGRIFFNCNGSFFLSAGELFRQKGQTL